MTMRATAILLLLAGLSCAGCESSASREGLPDVAAGERPALTTDEAGLWMVMDRTEQEVKTSGRVVTDPALNAYLRGVVCKIAPEYCGDLRLYLLQAPEFNASMAPNGFMVVLTGLLLRSRDEAQLAFVLAHEVSHYQRRHTLQRWRGIRAASNVLVLGQIASMDFGLYPIMAIALPLAVSAVEGVYAFSRDQEREADALGFARLIKSGYDPRGTQQIWRNLLAEGNVAKAEEQALFFATHPSSEERLEALRDMVAGHEAGTFTGEDELRAATLRFRATWLRDELRTRDFARFHVVLDQLKASNVNLGELYYFEGESFRLRDEPGDDRLAISAYLRAIGEAGTPPDVHRGLGEMFRRIGDAQQAQAAFREYLHLRPDAPERAMIDVYLQSGQ